MGESRRRETLNPQQEAFVEFYLQSWNASEAARKAGYSPQSAREIGSRLLTNVNIKAAIKERLAELCMTTNEWFVRVTAQARGDIGELLEDDGTISLRKARTRQMTRLISEYSIEETYRRDESGDPTPVTRVKVKLYSAKDALKMIGQRLGLLESDNRALLHELRALLSQHQLNELQKKEALLELLKEKASPDVYAEVERILTGGAASKDKSANVELEWDDVQSEEEDPASEAASPPEGDRP